MSILHEMKNRLNVCFLYIVKYKIHFIAWFFFIFYEIVITGVLRGYFASAGNYFIFYILNISLFYFHAHIILPKAHKNPKYTIWLIPLLIIVEVAVYVPLTIGIVAFLQQYADLSVFTKAVINKTSLGNGVWRTIYFILFSSGYYYLMNYLKARKITQQAERERFLMIIENQKIQAELVKTQYAHLKSQINPHFLFNTLNFIYSNTRKSVPDAAEAIMALSEMMRYALQDETESNFVSLISEIQQIENLIRLHQIKSENKLNITLKYDSNLGDTQIIPLMLITLVENIFKHGDLSKPDKPAKILISSDRQTLVVETTNLINLKATVPSHHIGLENTLKRLNMVYGKNALLEFNSDTYNYFNLFLSIKLN